MGDDDVPRGVARERRTPSCSTVVGAGGGKEEIVVRSAITKNQARARARERMGQRLAREAAFLEHAAAWELAHDAMNVALGRMYEAGFTRAEIAERLGIPTSRVVKPEEIAAAGGADSEESVVQGDESDEQAAGDDESRAVDVAANSGDDSGDH